MLSTFHAISAREQEPVVRGTGGEQRPPRSRRNAEGLKTAAVGDAARVSHTQNHHGHMSGSRRNTESEHFGTCPAKARNFRGQVCDTAVKPPLSELLLPLLLLRSLPHSSPASHPDPGLQINTFLEVSAF